MSEGSHTDLSLEDYIEVIKLAGGSEDSARLASGEAAALIARRFPHGGLKRAATEAKREYKSVAERARVVGYYENLRGRTSLAIGDSVARELLEEFPTLSWTHLRLAKGIDKLNPWQALDVLRCAVDQEMTPEQLKRHLARLRRKSGHQPLRIVISSAPGFRVIIERD